MRFAAIRRFEATPYSAALVMHDPPSRAGS
jgi:hypothetical protein